MAKLKGENLMVIVSTADVFRAAVCALSSPDGKDGVRFHTFTLPEDRCARLLVKNRVRGMPQRVVREELGTLNIRVQGVTQLRYGRRDPDTAKYWPPIPHLIVSVAREPEVSKVRSLTEFCSLRVSVQSYVAPKGPLQCNAASVSATRSVTADTQIGASLVVAPISPVDAVPHWSSRSAVAAVVTTQRTAVAV